MFFSRRNASSKQKEETPWLAASLKPENFVPGLLIGFLLGLFFDLSSARRSLSSPPPPPKGERKSSFPGKPQSIISGNRASSGSGSGSEELKMVLVVRHDLRMGLGKIASQCAHAATGMYSELLHSHRLLLRQWEQYGQAKIVLSCKNQQEMNRLKEAADSCGLPTFVVADAGRTQIQAGSRTVLAIGPGVHLNKFSAWGTSKQLIQLLENCDFYKFPDSSNGFARVKILARVRMFLESLASNHILVLQQVVVNEQDVMLITSGAAHGLEE